MKKIYLLVLTLIGVFSAQAQTVYSENMGVPTGTTAIATYVGGTAPATFQNGSPILYSGTADMRATTVSSGYTGASGGGNVFITNTITRFFLIEGINTSAYNTADLRLELGHYKSTVGATNELAIEVSTDGTTYTPLTYTRSGGIGWTLVSIASGIPSTTNLRIRFTQTIATAQFRLDDIVVKNVSSSCALVPGTPTTLCDASTLALDTYTITIPFTGGGTASYTITPTTGTVGGDNPNSVASGNITIIGTSEGVGNSVTITGGTCNFTIPVTAPANGCKPVNALPFNEPFNYTVGNVLSNEQTWSTLNTGDNILVTTGNLTYTGISSTGNSIDFVGAGAESKTPFTDTTSGTIYASFLASVTDLSNVTVDLTSTYFAALLDNLGGTTIARLWIRNNAGQYQYGLSSTTSAANIAWSPNLYNVGSTQYIIFGYDFTANSLALYENASIPSTATASVAVTPSAALTSIGGFLLRQDGAATTPTIKVDELYIDTAIPNITLSRNDFNAIAGLRVFPNPANTVLNITSDSFATKNVEIFNVVGAKVLSTQVSSNPVNVASLTTGIYMVKVTEEGKTATRKLVIE